MQSGKWNDPYIILGVGDGTNETDLTPFSARRATELSFLVDDKITPGTQNVTIKLYGSVDGGISWSQLYFFESDSNVFTSASAQNSFLLVKDTKQEYWTNFTHDDMKITIQRAAADVSPLQVTMKQRTTV